MKLSTPVPVEGTQTTSFRKTLLINKFLGSFHAKHNISNVCEQRVTAFPERNQPAALLPPTILSEATRNVYLLRFQTIGLNYYY